MAQIADEKLDSITGEVQDLHPLLNAVLPKLPRVQDVEYHHGSEEMGADFVISRTNDTFGNIEYVGVIAKVGKIVQDFVDIERQIDECAVPRLFRGGKEKIWITEIWVVATRHITQGAKRKIFHKYSTRRIEFIDGTALAKLVDEHAPLAWSGLPIVVGEYLQDLRVRTEEQDKSVSLLPISDKAFYVKQELYHLPDIEYRYKVKGHRQPAKVDVDHVTKSHRCILIEGGVGSGKSKLLRRLIAEATTSEEFSKTKVIPLSASYTELMEKHSGDLKKLIEQRVPKVVMEPCHDSEHLVLIDAFDERRMEINSQADELNALFGQASEENRIRVVVTSRFLKGVERGDALQPDVARCELHPLSMQRTFEFITRMCVKVNVKDRILEDLKKSALFRDLPSSPISAILLARLLNENQQEIPSNMTELYAKYSELILGRWDEKKGLQPQKEYQALDNILMRLARQMIDDQRLFISVDEVKAVFKDYLDQRNLEIDVDQLFEKMVDRCEIILLDSSSETLGFKHRSFTEFFYAKSFIQDQALVVDSRVFNVYWMNTFFFYLGLRKDCPNDLQAIFEMPTGSEQEEWLKIMTVSNYLLAAYTTPYWVVAEGIRTVAVTSAELYRKIVTQGSEMWFSGLPQMHLLCLLQMFIRQGYSYSFFTKAIEEAALRIDDSSLENETKAYALFFLNVAYIDIPKSGKSETFDFMLSRIQKDQKDFPVDLQLALRHEGKKVKERTALMRKQDKHLRRILPRGNALDMFIKNLYELPVSAVIQQSLKAQKKKKENKEAEKLPRRSRK